MSCDLALTSSLNSHLHHYCLIREDLPLGTIGAQLIHAGARSANGLHDDTTHSVCLAAQNERHLCEIEYRLIEAGIHHISIREPDEPWRNALMAIGIPPQPQKNLRKIFRDLKKLE